MPYIFTKITAQHLKQKKSTCHQAKLYYNVDVTIKTYTLNSNEAGRKEIKTQGCYWCQSNSLLLQ